MGFFSSPEQKANKTYQKAKQLLLENIIKNREKAGKLLLQAAQLGHADAQFDYGYLILGVQREKDYEQALSWVEKAAAQGHAKAIRCCVELYSGVQGHVPQDLDKAEAWAKKAQDAGLTEADGLCRAIASRHNPANLYELAMQEFQGEDHRPALADLEHSAEQGYLPAILECVRVYQDGTNGSRFSDWDVYPDSQKAMHWCEKAAKQGDAECQFQFAEYCNKQEGTDRLSAIHWYGEAAKQGHTAAFEQYLKNYQKDEMLESFLLECKQAAEQGSVWAGFICAELHCRGEKSGVDEATLFAWCKQAAENELMLPLTRCGWMYANGIGTAPNGQAALACYEKAAQHGYSEALFQTAQLYYHGAAGLPADKAKALALFKQAFAQDNSLPALAWCGKTYLLGEGCKIDRKEAWKCYNMALCQIDTNYEPLPIDNLDRNLFDLGRNLFLRKQEAIALPLLEDAANRRGYAGAYPLLAAIYQRGISGELPPDPARAASFFADWLRRISPGDIICFGRCRQNLFPEQYRKGAFPEPVYWQVLEIRPGKVLLLSCGGLDYNNGGVCTDLFSETELALVQEPPFHLSQAQFQKYIVENGRAQAKTSATLYATVIKANVYGLKCKLINGGKTLNISTDFGNDSEKRNWISLLTKPYCTWCLSDGFVDGETVRKDFNKKQAISRPAVWLSL